MKPLVSVIVPCRNEQSFIERSLDSILESDYPRLEVIVADGMSTDRTRQLLGERAARDPRLRIIDNPERITPVGLNRAIAVSLGEVVLRFDAHAVMPADYIRRLVELLYCSSAHNAGGSIRTLPQSNGPFAGPIVAVLGSRFGVGNSGFRTCQAQKGPRQADTVFGGCWRREVFQLLGGFNEQLARGQDLEFNLRLRRAGGKIVLDPEIVCDYYAPSDLASFSPHSFHNGVWAVLPFGASSIVPVRARHLIPLAFVTSLIASLVPPFPWSIAIASAYLLANLAASVRVTVSRRPSNPALLPIAFLTLHLAYGLGSAWGCAVLAAHSVTQMERGQFKTCKQRI
jgi:cellulose synthase/poly-beta-1,6-N-acetylglucosamine synthase-like glycosyltransferase